MTDPVHFPVIDPLTWVSKYENPNEPIGLAIFGPGQPYGSGGATLSGTGMFAVLQAPPMKGLLERRRGGNISGLSGTALLRVTLAGKGRRWNWQGTGWVSSWTVLGTVDHWAMQTEVQRNYIKFRNVTTGYVYQENGVDAPLGNDPRFPEHWSANAEDILEVSVEIPTPPASNYAIELVNMSVVNQGGDERYAPGEPWAPELGATFNNYSADIRPPLPEGVFGFREGVSFMLQELAIDGEVDGTFSLSFNPALRLSSNGAPS